MRKNRTPGGGWGYQVGIEDDADTTSLAIMAFRQIGERVPADAVDLVRSCFCADGGVATYQSGQSRASGWQRSTADVTPLALWALEGAVGQKQLDRGSCYLWMNQQQDGLWSSYWWLTRLYPTWAAIQWLRRRGPIPRRSAVVSTLAQYRAIGPFELALRSLILCELRVTPQPVSLLNAQLADGSWPGDAHMRLTDPDVLHPWRELHAGPLFPDSQRVFTTATAVAALARGRRASVLGPPSPGRNHQSEPEASAREELAMVHQLPLADAF